MPNNRSRVVRPLGGAGAVMLIGGAEDKLRGKRILSRLPLSLSSAPQISMTAPAPPSGRTKRERLFGIT